MEKGKNCVSKQGVGSKQTNKALALLAPCLYPYLLWMLRIPNYDKLCFSATLSLTLNIVANKFPSSTTHMRISWQAK